MRALATALLAALALGATGCEDTCGDLDERFLTYLTRREARYDLRLAREDGACDLALTADPDSDLTPSLSLKAGLLVYWTDEGGTPHLVVRELRNGHERTLDTGALVPELPEVSPDGTRVAFRGRTPPATAGELYVIPVGGGTPTPVAPLAAADDTSPAWSADGRSLFFTSNRSGRYQIWRVALDGSEPEQVSTDETAALTCGGSACAVQGKAAPSPDGREVAFVRATPAQQGTVVVRELATGAERVLAEGVACAEPSWSPDGGVIALLDLSYDDPEVVLRDAATGAYVRRLTSSPGIDGAPFYAR